MLIFGQKDDFCKTTYKIVRSKQPDPLHEVPAKWIFQAALLRSKIGSTALKIDSNGLIPPFAELGFGDAKIEFVRQEGHKIFFRPIEGPLPVHGTLSASLTAVTVNERLHQSFLIFGRRCGFVTSVMTSFQLRREMILRKFSILPICR